MIELDLPFPPSVNRIWRKVGRKTLISRDYRKWKTDAKNMLNAQWLCKENPAWLADRLSVEIYLTPDSYRRWDIDNRVKAVLDALEGTWIEDDHQIDRLLVVRLEKDSVSKCLVRLAPHQNMTIQDFCNHRSECDTASHG